MATFTVGDKVMWKGLLLTVEEVLVNGSVVAASATTRVVTDDLTQFELCNAQ